MHHPHRRSRAIGPAVILAVIATPAFAQPLAMTDTHSYPNTIFQEVLPSERDHQRSMPRYEATVPPEADASADLAPHLRRQIVNYPGREPAGTIVIDTPNTFLYYVLGDGRAIRYGIGVGREGFTWSGVQTVARKQEWPDWHPPADMIARQPYLPRFMSGGPGNPLGARALYLGNSLYRIHGTNDPSSIGKRMSSGCIRMTNTDAIDLYDRVKLGAKVVVLNDPRRRQADTVARAPAPQPAPAVQAERYEEPVVYAPRPAEDLPQYREPAYSAFPLFGMSRIY